MSGLCLPGLSCSLSLFHHSLQFGIPGGLDCWDKNAGMGEAGFDSKQKGHQQVLEEGHIGRDPVW
jgi:hypothetical protein